MKLYIISKVALIYLLGSDTSKIYCSVSDLFCLDMGQIFHINFISYLVIEPIISTTKFRLSEALTNPQRK